MRSRKIGCGDCYLAFVGGHEISSMAMQENSQAKSFGRRIPLHQK